MITATMKIGTANYPAVGDFVMNGFRGFPMTVFKAKVALGPAEKNDDVVVKYGYANPIEWRGKVIDLDKGGDLMTVTATGADELKLTETTFCESFIDETAEAIVRAALSATGLPIATIDNTGAQIARYSANTIPVWQAVFQVQETLRSGHGLTGYALYLGDDGLVWSADDRPGAVPEIVTGENLIDHAPSYNGFSKVTTFMLPGLVHSQRFSITDKRRGISGTFRAVRVLHELHDLQARTIIYYRRGE